MSKYIIEIDDNQLLEYDKDTDTYFRTLYKAKGFNALVFDKNGLDKLTPLDEKLEEAYQKGFEVGQHEATTFEYQRGLDEAWEAITKIAKMPDGERMMHFGEVWISNILNAYSLDQIFTILKKSEFEPDEIKVSDIITDGKINYLVIDITDKSYVALQGTDFEPVYIGKDYIKSYHNLHDSKDMRKIAEEINKAMKGEQRTCSTCKYSGGSDLSKCSDCIYSKDKGYIEWEPKEGA